MKIWHISDTHTYHKLLNPPDVDILNKIQEIYRDYDSGNIQYSNFLSKL